MARGLRTALGLLIVLGALRAICYLIYAVVILPLWGDSFHLESKMVLLAYRVQAGLSLYPSWREYPHVADFFGPLYFTLVGLLGRAFGSDIRGLFLIGRIVSVVSGLATSAGLGWYLYRRFGRGPACAGVLMSLGAEPMIGFSTMVRPDLLAETLAVAGFFVSGAQNARWRPLGFVLLVAAVLTKQTTAIFLVAAALALFLEGDRRQALLGLGGGLATIALVIAAATVLVEPNLARDFLGESRTPWSLPAWATILGRVCVLCADLPIFAVVGIVLWNTRKPRDVRSTVLAVVLLATSLVTSAKKGADLNYFLSLRVVEALAIATLWREANSETSRRGRAGFMVAAIAGIPAVALGLLFVGTHAFFEVTRVHYLKSPRGVVAERTWRRATQLAENSNTRILTDSGLVDLYQRERAAFGDPWLFRMLVESGQIQPTKMERWIEEEAYGLVVTTSDLRQPGYATYEFGLPMVLVEPLRRHYNFVGSEGGLFFYQRRGKGPDNSRTSPARATR